MHPATILRSIKTAAVIMAHPRRLIPPAREKALVMRHSLSARVGTQWQVPVSKRGINWSCGRKTPKHAPVAVTMDRRPKPMLLAKVKTLEIRQGLRTGMGLQ
jgi:hypothetical protein